MKLQFRNIRPAAVLTLVLSAVLTYPHVGRPFPVTSDKSSLEGSISSSLLARIGSAQAQDEILVWIFLKDHGAGTRSGASQIREAFGSQRSMERTRKRGGNGISADDPPQVCKGYVRELEIKGVKTRHLSRYLNAVSAAVRAQDIDVIASLPFVRMVDEVAVFTRREDPPRSCREGARDTGSMIDPWNGFYGESLGQLEMIESLNLLEEGYNCSGDVKESEPVMICVLDTGFDRSHEAFEHLKVEAEYDFIEYDSFTGTEEGEDPWQAEHGTTVLGAIGGFMPGELIGPAWGAVFVLGKTEIIDQEIRSEEDKWVAAVEWADSIGVDVISSSVGYIGTFSGYWYDPDSLNGDFAVCTRAADIAVSRGIVVVNAVGNKNWYLDSLIVTPADGDSVLAVGAVDRFGTIAPFSKNGPTADGRIKPDLVAQGVDVRSVLSGTYTGYASYDGTSYSTPLVAGLCGQLLEVHPEWDPMTLRDSLLATASRSTEPDNVYGYGIPRGFEASGLKGREAEGRVMIGSAYPNPFVDEVRFDVYFEEWDVLTVRVYDCAGRLVRTVIDELPLILGGTVVWDGMSHNGRRVASGVYFVRFVSIRHAESVKVVRLD